MFKTPTLREIEHTAPYMHDGSLKTLDEVVEFYNKGGIPNKNLDQNIKPLHLTEQEKADLVAFLKALSGEGWQHLKPPATFSAVERSASVSLDATRRSSCRHRSTGRRTTVKFLRVTVSAGWAALAWKSMARPAL